MEKTFRLEKPPSDFPKDHMQILIRPTKDAIRRTQDPVYLYWDKAKYKSPPDMEAGIFWSKVKEVRQINSMPSIIQSEEGPYFSWIKLPQYEPLLHEIDLHMGGDLFVFPDEIDALNKQQYISRGIIEEAIASSQLEGAVTTRVAAKQFLREGRRPTSYAEHMILNNYQSMKAIEEEYRNREIDISMLFELHAMITKNTIEKNRQGIFRKDEDNIIIASNNSEVIYFVPPKSAFVKKEIPRLIDFANDNIKSEFIHPIIKAIMLHFWVGYLHPFVDGNGRLARLLFYWYLLKKGYWAFAYLPISTIIKNSSMEYKMAYVYTEQDDYDMTYFIDYNMRKIELAKKEFQQYLSVKAKEKIHIRNDVKDKYNLNPRQVALLKYFYEHKNSRTSPSLHSNVYGVSKLTGINDLKNLLQKGFVRSNRVGRNVYYYPSKSLEELFKKG